MKYAMAYRDFRRVRSLRLAENGNACVGFGRYKQVKLRELYQEPGKRRYLKEKWKCHSWPEDNNLLFVTGTSTFSGVKSRTVTRGPRWKLLLITFCIVINVVHPLVTPQWGLCCALQIFFFGLLCQTQHRNCKWLTRLIILFYNTVEALKLAWIWGSYVILNQTTSKDSDLECSNIVSAPSPILIFRGPRSWVLELFPH